MKKLFFLTVAILVATSCERTFMNEEKTNSIKNDKKSFTKDSLQLSTEFEQEVDPGTIVPPRR
jgi:hypothetical protein